MFNSKSKGSKIKQRVRNNVKMKSSIILFNFLLVSFMSNAQSDSLPDPEAYFTAIIVNDIGASIS